MAIHETMLLCDNCGAKTAHRFEYPSELDVAVCVICGAAREIRIQERSAAYGDVTMTTAPSLPGFRITETLNIVSAECVLGTNILVDMMAGLTDAVGGRNESLQKQLKRAREICLAELRREAAAIGGNAVIAVDLDYSEISGGRKSMLFLVATGTAVRVEADPQ